MQTKTFRDLIVWQKAIELVKEVYHLSADMPQSELYGLVSQMRRSAVSIPSNIAEGQKRGTRKDYLRFLDIADGSAAELETQLIITQSVYPEIKCETAQSLLDEVQRMLTAVIQKLTASETPTSNL